MISLLTTNALFDPINTRRIEIIIRCEISGVGCFSRGHVSLPELTERFHAGS